MRGKIAIFMRGTSLSLPKWRIKSQSWPDKLSPSILRKRKMQYYDKYLCSPFIIKNALQGNVNSSEPGMKYFIKVQFWTPKVADIAATHAVRTTTLKQEKVIKAGCYTMHAKPSGHKM